jgi:Leucine-rich repeat (LRR) protein
MFYVDVISEILYNLDIYSIINLQKLNKYWHKAAKNDGLWQYLLKKDYPNINVKEKSYYETYKKIYILQKLKHKFKMYHSLENIEKANDIIVNNFLYDIPLEICILANMEYIIINNSQIKKITNIESLTKLKILCINESKLKLFPNISQLIKIKKISFYSHNLCYLPKNISCNSELEILHLNNGNINRLHKNIGKLTKLVNLQLAKNKIKKIPDVFHNLKKLDHLNLANNLIKKIPDSIFLLQNLTDLNLSNNKLCNINVNSLINLKLLDLAANNFIECPDIHRLTKLEKLFLNDNYIKFIDIYLPSLKTLYLSSNPINQLPKNINLLTNLIELSIDNTNIYDISNIIYLIKLQVLSLNKICQIPLSFKKDHLYVYHRL